MELLYKYQLNLFHFVAIRTPCAYLQAQVTLEQNCTCQLTPFKMNDNKQKQITKKNNTHSLTHSHAVSLYTVKENKPRRTLDCRTLLNKFPWRKLLMFSFICLI